MTGETILTVYNLLKSNPDILSALNASEGVVEERILKTRQPGHLADSERRLAIWEDKPEEFNKRVNQHNLFIDVVIPLRDQQETGVAHVLSDLIRDTLRGAPIGTGLKYYITLSDLPINYGWYKASVIFKYNRVGK